MCTLSHCFLLFFQLISHRLVLGAYNVPPKGIFSTSEIAVAIYGISSPGSTLFHAMNTLALCATWRFNHRQEVHSIQSDVVMCAKYFKIKRLCNGLTSAFKWLGLKPVRKSLSSGKICAGLLNFGPRFSPTAKNQACKNRGKLVWDRCQDRHRTAKKPSDTYLHTHYHHPILPTF